MVSQMQKSYHLPSAYRQTAYLAAVVHLAVHAWYFKEMLGILDYGVHKMDSKSCYEIGQSFKLFP